MARLALGTGISFPSSPLRESRSSGYIGGRIHHAQREVSGTGMSRSKKDGRKGGNHNQAQRTGKEYWSPRGRSMMEPGKESKKLTHRMDRKDNQKRLEEERDDS
jgi:hypothetical protein